MKKIVLSAAMLLIGSLACAQQALWGMAPVVSPEVHEDNTVRSSTYTPTATW